MFFNKKLLSLLAAIGGVIIQGCMMNTKTKIWTENQITTGEYGHFLNPIQSFSPDDQWIIYDTRNADPDIGRTGRIERINLPSKEVDSVYQSDGQSEYGPGVGAAAYSTVDDRVIFIHGLPISNKDQPYGISRRTGTGVHFDQPDQLIHYDARDVSSPYTLGALRGGSHAHSWSGDGSWISFTYNDDVMSQRSLKDTSVKDLRMVGVMAPWGEVHVPEDDQGENNDGTMFSMVISRVTENPIPGSDEISKAYEDGWIGRNGYVDASGTRHHKAVAFLGDVRDAQGNTVTEVFVVDLPEEKPDLSEEEQLKGNDSLRPQPLSMVQQRRVTFTTDRKHLGVQGPRQWMKSSPDGATLYFMMKDDSGVVQLFAVPTIGGEVRQITSNDFSIQTAFDIDPDGKFAAYGSGEKIYLTTLESGDTKCLTPQVEKNYAGLRAIQWSHSGKYLTYNRKVKDRDSSFFQIFTLSKDE